MINIHSNLIQSNQAGCFDFKDKLLKTLILGFLLCFSLQSVAQTERKLVQEGNKNYEAKKFSEAEINYRKSLEKNKNSVPGTYNLGNSFYKQDKMDEAAQQYQQLLTNKNISTENKAKAYHSLGNTLLKADKFKESIEAYKNSLKLNPKDNDTRYNLAYAQSKLQQQQNQQQSEGDKNKEENKDQKKDQQGDEKKDEQKEGKENQENKQGEKQEQNQEEKSAQKSKEEISKEDAEKILQALNNDEKQTQKKLTKS